MHRASIGLILSVVLVGAAGCGRSRVLSVPSGADASIAGADASIAGADASIAGADVQKPLGGSDGMAALDASVPPDALPDASACLPYPCPTGRSWNPELCACAAIDAGDTLAAALDGGMDGTTSLPPNRYRAIAISVGRLNNCALLDDHRVKCWGENGYGQLGLGDTMNRGPDPAGMGDNLPTVDLGTGRTAKSVTAGFQGTCAILDDDELKCWGGRAAPNGTSNIGDQPGEMGDQLQPIDVGVGRKAVAAVNALEQTCAALDDGSFLCWGGPASSIAAAADGAWVVQFVRDIGAVGVFDDGSVRRISNGSPSGPDAPRLRRPARIIRLGE